MNKRPAARHRNCKTECNECQRRWLISHFHLLRLTRFYQLIESFQSLEINFIDGIRHHQASDLLILSKMIHLSNFDHSGIILYVKYGLEMAKYDVSK